MPDRLRVTKLKPSAFEKALKFMGADSITFHREDVMMANRGKDAPPGKHKIGEVLKDSEGTLIFKQPHENMRERLAEQGITFIQTDVSRRLTFGGEAFDAPEKGRQYGKWLGISVDENGEYSLKDVSEIAGKIQEDLRSSE